MKIRVRIPTHLRRLTSGRSEVEADGPTVRDLIDDLESNFPGIKELLVDQAGEIHRFVNLYVNDEDVRYLDGRQTALTDGDRVSIVPAVAGGCCLYPDFMKW